MEIPGRGSYRTGGRKINREKGKKGGGGRWGIIKKRINGQVKGKNLLRLGEIERTGAGRRGLCKGGRGFNLFQGGRTMEAIITLDNARKELNVVTEERSGECFHRVKLSFGGLWHGREHSGPEEKGEKGRVGEGGKCLIIRLLQKREKSLYRQSRGRNEGPHPTRKLKEKRAVTTGRGGMAGIA